MESNNLATFLSALVYDFYYQSPYFEKVRPENN